MIMQPLKTLFAGLMLAFALFTLPLHQSGCTGLNRNVYNTENLAVDSVKAGVHAFNQFYASSTNSPGADVAALNSERDQIYAAEQKFYQGVKLVDSLRLAYAANSADTNKAALTLSLEVLGSQSSNIVATVKQFMGGK